MAARKPKFEPFEDKAQPGKWRWRLRGANGEKVATSGESFASRSNALRAARTVKRLAAAAEIEMPVLVVPRRKRLPQARSSGVRVRLK